MNYDNVDKLYNLKFDDSTSLLNKEKTIFITYISTTYLKVMKRAIISFKFLFKRFKS